MHKMLGRSRLTILLVTMSVFVFACGVFYAAPRVFTERAVRPEGDGLANGERIYFTATKLNGELVTYRGGPDFGGMMMGAYLTCAACHGPEARGGVHFMHMQVMDAPDIRYVSLSAEEGEHGESEGEGHADEHGAYSLEDFRQAVVDGKHPDGEALSRDMPRWEISDEDLADLFEFLKSIP